MRVNTLLFVLAVAVLFAIPATAQTVSIPRYTVIPVVMQDSLSSATANVGDQFYVKCSTAQCAGFPANTQFLGTVTSVTRRAGSTPGQIDVSFVQALLPNGQRVNITGTLTSLDPNEVTTDPQTGTLTGTVETRDDRNKFIGYGAGAGLLIGALTGNTIEGALIGAAAGWILGATIGTEREVREALVPVGTEFGIMLQNPVSFTMTTGAGPGTQPTTPPTCPPVPPSGAGPDELNIRLTGMQPYRTAAGVLMVPFRATMDEIDQPFAYSAANRSVTTTTSRGTITHTMGTNFIMLDGNRVMLPTNSRVVNGNLYVPADVFVIATGRTSATWNANTDTLILR